MLQRGKVTLVIICINLLILIPALTAAPLGKIQGNIVDQDSGQPIDRSVHIFIDGAEIGAGSDLGGKYNLVSIPSGKYDVTFSSLGYETKTVENVSINMAVTTLLDIKLEKQASRNNEISAITK
jgi:hypothetical protein